MVTEEKDLKCKQIKNGKYTNDGGCKEGNPYYAERKKTHFKKPGKNNSGSRCYKDEDCPGKKRDNCIKRDCKKK